MKVFLHIVLILGVVTLSMIGLTLLSGKKLIPDSISDVKKEVPVVKVEKVKVKKSESKQETIAELNKLNDIENAKLKKANDHAARLKEADKKFNDNKLGKKVRFDKNSIEELNKLNDIENAKLRKRNAQVAALKKVEDEWAKNNPSEVAVKKEYKAKTVKKITTRIKTKKGHKINTNYNAVTVEELNKLNDIENAKLRKRNAQVAELKKVEAEWERNNK